MSQMSDWKIGGWTNGVLAGAAAIVLLTGCGDSTFGTFRSMPAPLRNDFPYELAGRQLGDADSDSCQILADGTTHYVVLQGVDAPKRGQPYYQESLAEMRRLIAGKPVRVIVVGRDSHEREIGFVFIANESTDNLSSSPTNESMVGETALEIDVGQELIRLGLGWYDGNEFDIANNHYVDRYKKAEENARALRLGLWVEDNPVPPWEYR